jgi:hypothetical protein
VAQFAGTIRQEEFTLPSGSTVVIRPLTASEALDIGIGEGHQQLSGPQIRKAICRASRDPKFVDDENPQHGSISVYAIPAEDELALLNKILDVSFGAMLLSEVI